MTPPRRRRRRSEPGRSVAAGAGPPEGVPPVPSYPAHTLKNELLPPPRKGAAPCERGQLAARYVGLTKTEPVGSFVFDEAAEEEPRALPGGALFLYRSSVRKRTTFREGNSVLSPPWRAVTSRRYELKTESSAGAANPASSQWLVPSQNGPAGRIPVPCSTFLLADTKQFIIPGRRLGDTPCPRSFPWSFTVRMTLRAEKRMSLAGVHASCCFRAGSWLTKPSRQRASRNARTLALEGRCHPRARKGESP